ncbi:MAG: type III pantothenate kinase, partial [Muribaculaceae bacterium]|nr:type III pantothenate kinase [Muribaculaceae bacterium]
RVAAAVGASLIAECALIVDAGTAVTLDVIAGKAFKGGNISPGLRLRFRSLNCFTSRLPLVNPAGALPEFGYDTETALRSGVVNGIVDEIENTFHRGAAVYRGLRLLLTGGDADYLAPLLRKRGLQPEIVNSLVGSGLCEIYKYNMATAESSE